MAGKSMQEVTESGELKTFFDRRLIKALCHPVREHILAVLNERIASAREIGEELGAEVSSFYHHIEELEKFGCIERGLLGSLPLRRRDSPVARALTRKRARLGKYRVEHWLCETPREGVLLTGVIAAKQGPIANCSFRAVSETRLRARHCVAELPQ